MRELLWKNIVPAQSPHWKNNIIQFGKFFPEQVVLLKNIEKIDSLEYFELSPQKYLIQDKNTKFIFYNHNHFQANLQQNYNRLQEFLRRGAELFIIAGSGLGYLASHIESDIKGNLSKGILLIEPKVDLVVAQFCLYDCQSLINSYQFYWVFGDDILWQFKQLIDREKLYWIPTQKIVAVPERNLKPGEELIIRQLHNVFQETCSNKRSEISKKRSAFEKDMQNQPNLDKGNLWAATTPDAYAHTPLMQSLVHGFNQLGWNTHNINIYDGFTTRFKIAEHIIDSKPDLFLVCNSPSSSFVSKSINRPRLVWILDHPMYYSLHEFEEKITQWDHILFSDRTYEKYFQSYHCAGKYHFTTGPSIVEKGQKIEEMKAHIMFVGSHYPVAQLLAGLNKNQKEKCLLLAEELIKNPKFISQEILQLFDFDQSTNRAIINQSTEYCATMHRSFPNENAKVDYFFYTLANNVKRERYIENLLPHGLVVYGPDTWLHLLGNDYKSSYRGWLLHQDLKHAYRSAEICLNIHSIQCPTCFNSRDFDILASGGCLLSDYVEDMDGDILKPGQDFVMYHDVDSFIEKANHLLNNPDQREQIINSGHQTYLDKHTPAHRAEEILNNLI